MSAVSWRLCIETVSKAVAVVLYCMKACRAWAVSSNAQMIQSLSMLQDSAFGHLAGLKMPSQGSHGELIFQGSL